MNTLQLLQLHGWLMWASMGFLFPLGTLVIRLKLRPNVSAHRAKVLYEIHKWIQIVGVILAILGIAILIGRIGPKFDYTHMRLGLALFIIALALPIIGLGLPMIGLGRPAKGSKLRPYWFIFHWGAGTFLLVLGIVDCYIGIHAYEQITKLSLRTLNILFSIQVSVMTLLWVLQDRWDYIWNVQGKEQQERASPHQFVMEV